MSRAKFCGLVQQHLWMANNACHTALVIHTDSKERVEADDSTFQIRQRAKRRADLCQVRLQYLDLIVNGGQTLHSLISRMVHLNNTGHKTSTYRNVGNPDAFSQTAKIEIPGFGAMTLTKDERKKKTKYREGRRWTRSNAPAVRGTRGGARGDGGG